MLLRKCLQVIFLFYISLTFGNGLEYLTYFIKVQHCDLKDAKTLMTLDVDAFDCSKRCFETSACKSFVSRTISPRCILYENDSTEKILTGENNAYFYQLRRTVPTKYRDGKCPMDVVDNAFLPGNNDISDTSGHSYTACIYRCEANPNCQSFDYGISSGQCILSSKNHDDSSKKKLMTRQLIQLFPSNQIHITTFQLLNEIEMSQINKKLASSIINYENTNSSKVILFSLLCRKTKEDVFKIQVFITPFIHYIWA
ncbi:uncharacterized protein LOC118761180 [Octopus sinensis]|uniref:Uncharacterized protein LOC118761180 n=1 Tax=Octopus sinensis TaxID=2607531 RepID=A0A7E6EHQ5_9MOLL|nr:uncharacterized protein LOC118761180 [Octopus sinensis]